MEFRKEIITLPREFPFDLYDAKGHREGKPVLHFHDCLEINYIKEGSGLNIIEEKEYELLPGDFYVINNLERHMGVSDGTLVMQVLLFDPYLIGQFGALDYEYLSPFFERKVHFSNRINASNPMAPELLRILGEIEQEWAQQQEGFRLVIKALLMKLLAILYRHFKLNNELGGESLSFRKAYEKIRCVVEHINDNYRTRLTLDELAAIAHMNRTYLSTCFHQVMQISISDYIETLRIHEACRLLKTSTENITEVALASGYNQVPHFNKVFRRCMGRSPSEYRRGHPNKG